MVLFDDDKRANLLPLVFTRPIAALRIGILTIAEKWEKYLDESISFEEVNDSFENIQYDDYLSDKANVNG